MLGLREGECGDEVRATVRQSVEGKVRQSVRLR